MRASAFEKALCRLSVWIIDACEPDQSKRRRGQPEVSKPEVLSAERRSSLVNAPEYLEAHVAQIPELDDCQPIPLESLLVSGWQFIEGLSRIVQTVW